MTLTVNERDLLTQRDTVLGTAEKMLVELAIDDLFTRAKQTGLILKTDDALAKLEASLVRYMLESRGIDTTIADNGFPALDIDKVLWKKEPMHTRAKNERKVVYALLTYLIKAGFKLERVYDGEESTYVADAKAAMELIFNLDESHVWVQREGFKEHSIYIVLGNADDGSEVAADWSYTEGDPDGFNMAMDDFKPENYV